MDEIEAISLNMPWDLQPFNPLNASFLAPPIAAIAVSLPLSAMPNSSPDQEQTEMPEEEEEVDYSGDVDQSDAWLNRLPG